MLKKATVVLIPILVVLLVVSFLSGCNGAGSTTPIKVVPQQSDMLAYIDLSQIMEDEEGIAELTAALAQDPETQQIVDDVLDLLRNLDEAVFFGDIAAMSEDESYMGLIVKGTFEESSLLADIEELMEEELTTVGYKSYKIHTDQFQEAGIAFLGDDGFVFAPMDPLKDVIDVKEGDLSAVSGKLLTTYNNLGEPMVKMAMLVPPGAMEGLLEETGEIPMDLSALSDMDSLGLAVDEKGELIAIDAQLCFTSSDSAQEVENMITSLLLVVGMAPDIPQEVLDILEALEVSRSGDCLSIGLEITEAQGESLMGIFIQSSESLSF